MYRIHRAVLESTCLSRNDARSARHLTGFPVKEGVLACLIEEPERPLIGIRSMVPCEDRFPIAHREYRFALLKREENFEEVELGDEHPGSQRRCRLEHETFALEIARVFAIEIEEDLVCVQEVGGEKFIADPGCKVCELPGEDLRVVFTALEQAISNTYQVTIGQGLLSGHGQSYRNDYA